ncbi:MAG: hypothetical protein MJ192_05705 [Clostridia bacterium]|nr:hypothetical protein [Clostridia bacterium]
MVSYKIYVKNLVRKLKNSGKRKKEFYESYKEICAKHKDDWKPVTRDELKGCDKHDKYTYTVAKNMGDPANGPLSDYVTPYQYCHEFLPRLSEINHTLAGRRIDSLFTDKNYFGILFPDLLQPVTVLRRMGGQYFDVDYRPLTKEEALEKVSAYDQLVFKVSRGSRHGYGVSLIKNEGDNYEKALKDYGKHFIVQEVLRQHESTGYFNSSSVNIIRMTTLNWKGHVYVLHAKLRIGAPGSFTDLGVTDRNPLELVINEDGSFGKIAYDFDYAGTTYPDVFGKEIRGCIPDFPGIVTRITAAHMRFPDYGIIGWDLAIDEEGRMVLIEANSNCPAVFCAQCMHGPFFARLSADGRPLKDEIMSKPLNYDMKVF